MKNLVLVLAVLVSGVVNGQVFNFNDAKFLIKDELGINSQKEDFLFENGFEKVGNDSIVFDIFSNVSVEDEATLFINDSLGIVLKVSERSLEIVWLKNDMMDVVYYTKKGEERLTDMVTFFDNSSPRHNILNSIDWYRLRNGDVYTGSKHGKLKYFLSMNNGNNRAIIYI